VKNTTQNDDSIHLVLTVGDLSDDYNQHAGVTFLSFLDHCKSKVVLHIIHDDKYSIQNPDKCAINKLYFEKIAEKYGAVVSYSHFEIPSIITTLPALKNWNEFILMRLFLPDVLWEVSKVIYLDCDIVVNTDVDNLWDIPLNGFSIAACPDSGREEFGIGRKRLLNKMNINTHEYFCAGLLVMDLEKLRITRELSCDVINFFMMFPNTPYPDQDALNSIFNGQYCHLEEKYNIYAGRVDSYAYASDCMIHYAGGNTKPWKGFDEPIGNFYWKYYFATPWSDNKEALLNLGRRLPDKDYLCDMLPIILRKYHHTKKVTVGIRLILKIIQSELVIYLGFIKYESSRLFRRLFTFL
jgi:lipopolysaccharide biosynthesis glycosyltransferase